MISELKEYGKYHFHYLIILFLDKFKIQYDYNIIKPSQCIDFVNKNDK